MAQPAAAVTPHPAMPVTRIERHTDITTDTWTVAISIDPTTVIPALARALSGHAADLLTIRTRKPGDQMWHDAVNRISQSPAVLVALTLPLTPVQANRVAVELEDCSCEIRCDMCGGLREHDSIPECEGCTGDDEAPEVDA